MNGKRVLVDPMFSPKDAMDGLEDAGNNFKIPMVALPFVDISTPLDELSGMISGDRMAVLLKDFKAGRTFILTKSDIVDAFVK